MKHKPDCKWTHKVNCKGCTCTCLSSTPQPAPLEATGTEIEGYTYTGIVKENEKEYDRYVKDARNQVLKELIEEIEKLEKLEWHKTGSMIEISTNAGLVKGRNNTIDEILSLIKNKIK